MSGALRSNLLTMLLAFAAALLGMVAGHRLMQGHSDHHATELHALLHANVALDARQDAALDALEARFAVTRATLEAEMRTDNVRLAAAIEREHGNGPAVVAALDRSHRTMGALQKATLAHVFAMRQLLRPDQKAAFDRLVVRALTTQS